MSDLYELYQRRASVRKFKPEPLREGDLDKLLLAAQRAPTDATAQMYSLLRISDPVLRREISSHSGQNPHIETCAEFFLILADVHRLQKLVEHRGGPLDAGPAPPCTSPLPMRCWPEAHWPPWPRAWATALYGLEGC